MYVYVEFDIKMLSLYRIRHNAFVATKGAASRGVREKTEREREESREAGRAGGCVL